MRIQDEVDIAINVTMPIAIALVGCGKLKAALPREVRIKAKDLYRGVPFRMAFHHAISTADDVHILSAMHGLLDPYLPIASYDCSMVQIPPSKHLEWGQRVLLDLKAAYPLQRLAITFYAGQQYIRPIMRAITNEESYWTFENPLEGLDLFERLKWFKTNAPPEQPPF